MECPGVRRLSIATSRLDGSWLDTTKAASMLTNESPSTNREPDPSTVTNAAMVKLVVMLPT